MGVVYRAWQPSLCRQVALKCLLRSGDPKSEGRFAREIRALGRVEHPHLVKAFASGSHGEHWYYAMELVEGADLARVCDVLTRSSASEVGLPEWQRAVSAACETAKQKEQPLSSSDAVRFRPNVSLPPSTPAPAERRGTKGHTTQVVELIRQVADGAHRLHEAGVIHRDIKPGNILVTPDGQRAVLIDLGLAQLADDVEGRLTRTRQFVGTLRYASPEQVLAAGTLDRRSDLYSLGATLWELLTLRPLFGAGDGTSPPELMQKIQYAEPEGIRKFNPNVPDDLQAVVQKCLEKDRNRRYATAQDFADDLASWLQGGPVKAEPPTLKYLLGKFVRRYRVPLAAACLLFVLVCAGVAAAFQQINDARGRAVTAFQAEAQARAQSDLDRNTARKSVAALQARLQELAFSHVDSAAENHAAGRHRIGLHWSLLAYQTLVDAASPPDDPLRRAVRRLIAGWQTAAGQTLVHDSGISAVAFSPDGRTIVTGSDDKTARLWDAATGKAIADPIRHEGAVTAVAFTPDGRTVATVSQDMTARLWDAATGKPVGEPMRHQDSINSLAFSADGRTIVTASRDETARLWNAGTGKPIGEPMRHADDVDSATFSPDGRTVLTASADKTARLWDAATGKPVGEPMRHEDRVRAVAFSPDGRMILTGSDDKSARLWNADFGEPSSGLTLTSSVEPSPRVEDSRAATGKPVGGPILLEAAVTAVAFSPDGRTMLTVGADKTARLWDPWTREPVGEPMRHEDSVTSAAFSPDGRTLVTGSDDKTARLWDAETAKPIGEPMRSEGSVTAVAFSPDGRTILTGSRDMSARLWEAAAGTPIGEPMPQQAPLRAIELGPDGRTILALSAVQRARLFATIREPVRRPIRRGDRVWSSAVFSWDGRTVLTGVSDKTVRVWDAGTRKPVGEPMSHDDFITSAAFNPNGPTIVTASADKTARLWDAASGKPFAEPMRHADAVLSVAFTPNGRTVATGCEDNTARLWDAATAKPIGPPLRHESRVWAVAFSPDGRTLATGSEDKTARLWDAGTGMPIGEPMRHDDFVGAVVFSPDGRTILTRTRDVAARLWDATTGKPIGEPMRHDDRVRTIAFSSDGRKILTGSDDKTARLWDAATGKSIAEPIRHNAAVRSVAFSPDGRTFASGSEDGTAWLWDTATGKLLAEPLRQDASVHSVKFSPDSRWLLTASMDYTARLWPVPQAVPDEPERVRLWVETRTGTYRVDELRLQPLSLEQLKTRRDRLEMLGGPLSSRAADVDWHRTQAADSERNQAWFAAAFHLKYLIAASSSAPEAELGPYRLGRANSLLQLGNFDEERAEMDEVLAQDPRNVEAFRRRAEADLGLRDYERALADVNRSIEYGPPNASAFNLRGECHAEQGQWRDAVSDFAKAFSLAPSSGSLCALGAAQLGAGDLAALSATCAKLLSRENESTNLADPIAAGWLAVSSSSLATDWKQCVASARELCEEQPRSVAGHELLGSCLLRAGRFSDAARELANAVELSKNGGTWSTHLFLGLAEAQLKSVKSAPERLRNAEREIKSLRAPHWTERLRFRLLCAELSKSLSLAGPSR
jgi:WD40 repeat protein/serine/threonine protein kinase/tetratricopeptide (TPR) repeat protein